MTSAPVSSQYAGLRTGRAPRNRAGRGRSRGCRRAPRLAPGAPDGACGRAAAVPRAVAKTLFGNSASGRVGATGKAERRQRVRHRALQARCCASARAGSTTHAEVHVAVVAGRLFGQREAVRRDQEGGAGGGGAVGGRALAGVIEESLQVARDHAGSIPTYCSGVLDHLDQPAPARGAHFAEHLAEHAAARAGRGTGRACAG